MRSTMAGLCLIAACSLPAAAQQHVHASPYAGQHRSEIPSLSPEELEQLRSGDGMGLARAAELNHFPGPLHVLELADSLALTSQQRQRITAIRQRMSEAAIRVGNQIIEKERELNQRFAHAHIDAETLKQMTAEIARLQGELRATHLLAHIETTAVLQPAQIQAYDRLRGYTDR